MQLEARAHETDFRVGDRASVLEELRRPEVNLVIWQRSIPAPPSEAFIVDDVARCVEIFRRLAQEDEPRALLTTYVGPGTEWIPGHAVNRRVLDEPIECAHASNSAIVRDPSAVRRARAGDVMIMKGRRWPGEEGRGAVHRSPPIAGTGQRRILLMVTA